MLQKQRTKIEQAIAEYDYIGKEIKVLEEQRKALKTSLEEIYFNKDTPVYRDINGCILATYNKTTREFLKAKDLQKALPDIYEQYKYISEWFELRIK